MSVENYYRAPDCKPEVHKWLARARKWDIEYKAYLSNHIAHNWVVMGGVKAPEETFQWWEDLYSNQLGEKPSREPGDLEEPRQYPGDYTVINRLNWRNNVQSTRVAFPAFRDFFDQELETMGIEKTLCTYLPELLPGLAGAALHPLIHAGWAADVKNADMLGEGLAYMATSYQPLATSEPHKPPENLWAEDGSDILDATVKYLTDPKVEEWTATAADASETSDYKAVNRGGFQHRIMAFNDPELDLAASLNDIGPVALPPLEESLTASIEQLTALAASCLLASDNEFFVLHGLTSLHGLLVMLPHLEPKDRRDAIVYWWRAFLATMVVQNRPCLDQALEIYSEWSNKKADAPEPAVLTEERSAWWVDSISSVLKSRDEHVPKAVYVLWRWSAWSAFGSESSQLFERAARNLVRPHPSGEAHQHLWFAKSFSEASKEKEHQYD